MPIPFFPIPVPSVPFLFPSLDRASKWPLSAKGDTVSSAQQREQHLKPQDMFLGSKYTKNALAAGAWPQTHFWCI